MRVKFSEYSALPFYSTREEQHYYNFDNNIPVIVYPDFASIQFQFCFKEENVTVQGFTVKSENDTHVPTSVTHSYISEDVDGDGNLEHFLQVTAFNYASAPTESKYWIEILIDGVTYYSEVFFICNVDYKFEWWDDCDRQDFGYFSNGFKNILYVSDMYLRQTGREENIVERQDGYGNSRKVYQGVYTSYTTELRGSNFLKQTFDNIKYADNVQLTNLDSDVVWDLSEVSSENSGDNGVYALNVGFRTELNEKLDCGADAYENAPYIDPDEASPGDLTCGSFSVSIIQTGFELSYSLSNDPDPATPPDILWTRDGRWIGNGATATLGAYGKYGVRIQKKNCIVVDYYSWEDVCVAMQSNITVNNGTIDAATSNAPAAVSYEVFNPSGVSVATSLPYVAVVDGVHSLKVTSDTCQKVYQVPVTLGDASDCSFTFDIEKNASNLLTVANVSEASYSVEWLKVVNADEETSVGSGDTHQIDGEGLYIARVTALSCTKDKLFVFVEDDSYVTSKYIGYQRNINYSGADLSVTKFTLPHPIINSESDIDARLKVTVNGVRWHYKTTPSAINEFSFDYPNNKIVPFVAFTTDDVLLERFYLEN